MSLLIESIKLIDGQFKNLVYHEMRMKDSLNDLCGLDEEFHLEEFLQESSFPTQGLFKCRIVYDDQAKQVEYIPYTAKSINSLKVVVDNNISYEYKFTDRDEIDKLYAKRDGQDDILIIKDGLVTDSSFSNIVFKRRGEWLTPWSALLRGTQRQYLLETGVIKEEEIEKDSIHSFESFRLINAMLEFEGPEITTSNIIF